MSRVLVGLLVSTLLAKFGAQQDLAIDQSPHSFHANRNKKFNAKHRILDEFDKPSSVRLNSNRAGGYFRTSVYKCNPVKESCDLNYNIFSNDQQSDQIRSDYEVWNFHAPQSEPRIQRLSKRNRELEAKSKAQYTKLVDSPENKPYLLDDDYSLVNYVDNWKGLDPDHKIRRFHRKSEKKTADKKLHFKRDLDDKEFQVEFHSSKDSEFKGKLSNSYELANGGRRKSSASCRKVKSHFRSKYERNYGYFNPPMNHYKSKPKYTACKKKHLWGQKRAKEYPKLGPKSGFLDELETRPRSNMVAMGHVWHWATTRNYVTAAITPRKEFVATRSQEMGIMPQAFIPVMNLSDSLVRKSFKAKMNPHPIHPLQNAAVAQKLLPQYFPSANLQIGLPSNREVAVAFKPVLNQNHKQNNLGNPTRRPSVLFNRHTEYINPYENHYENFKCTPFWNARQGPPELRGVLGSPVRFSNFQGFKIAPNVIPNEQLIKPSLSLSGLFDRIREDPATAKSINESSLIHKFKVMPVTKQEPVPVKQTPKVFETADIVNLLQSALLPQSTKDHQVATTSEETVCALLPQSISIDKMLDMIAPSRSTLSISKPLSQAATENAVQSETEDSKLIVDATKEALLSLFTTEEPIMESLEDILKRNTDRKIPIVYDIEDAPQLSAQKFTEKPSKNISHFQDEGEPESHVLNRRGILKKNKTAIKHKTVQRVNSANTTLTTPWIVLATTENMLYSEIMEMERQKMNMTKKSKSPKSASINKINLLFQNKLKSNETTNEPTKATNEPKMKRKRDKKAVAVSRPGTSYHETVTSELRCGKCTCGCHTTPRPTWCCRCRTQPPLELTTEVSCGPANLSSGSISCPDCHQEFTYKLGLRPLINC